MWVICLLAYSDAASFIISNFFFLESFLNADSALHAEDLSICVSAYTNFTGRLELVYFAALGELLCSFKRRSKSVVMPV